MKRLVREEAGMTLVELLVVCSVLVVVMGAGSDLFVSGLQAGSRGQAQLSNQGGVRSALDRLDYDARCADTATVLSSGAGVHLHLPSQCTHATGDVSWCVSSGSLVRLTAQTCSGTGQTFTTDVTSATPFCVQTVTGDTPQLYVSLSADADTRSGDATSATDVITLRNESAATSTSAACP
ncbi:MAG TPA: prepilin-type N-terminal cleavage/methylation domain-containing protein [Gaiellaceae bacterium]|nr:prepilin-type N-terminal cleavage/methylation domain-containing protein [Gaiellaceae bacterium]